MDDIMDGLWSVAVAALAFGHPYNEDGDPVSPDVCLLESTVSVVPHIQGDQ